LGQEPIVVMSAQKKSESSIAEQISPMTYFPPT
jgi:hypothetical protein